MDLDRWFFVDLVTESLGGAKGQPAAPIETFARIYVFSCIFIDCMDLDRF